MSLGVNLLAALTRKVAEALDADFDIEILEMHHRHKVDAPSGTALMLGKAAAEGRGVELDKVSVRVRDGHTGARRRGDIGFATLRGGSVVGEHTVVFAADGELIELTHRAADRGIFARGAVKAALWGRGKGPGLFSMMDVLGLEAAKPKTVAPSRLSRTAGTRGIDRNNVLVLVRHGESEWNKLNLFTGWKDPDLTDEGRRRGACRPAGC